jgi:hypothetical protein
MKELPGKKPLEKMAYDFLEHLGCRFVDTCNSLIGRPPSHRLADEMSPFYEERIQIVEKYGEEIDLVDMIQRWKYLGTHHKRIEKEILSVFSGLISPPSYQRGSFVIVRVDDIPSLQRLFSFINFFIFWMYISSWN